MYTASWCSDCWRAKRFLQAKSVAFDEVDIDGDEEAAQLVMKENGGRRSVPTFEIDGVFHANPRLSELATLLGVE